MAYEEKDRYSEVPHHVILEDRERLVISGVTQVESFDENTIVMDTTMGVLVVRGEGLHIGTLSLDGGDLKVDGSVDAITYESDGGERGGLLRRLFR